MNAATYDSRRYASRVAQGRCVRCGERLRPKWDWKTCGACLAEVRENARDNYWAERGKEIPKTASRRGPVPAPLPPALRDAELDACRCEGPCDCA